MGLVRLNPRFAAQRVDLRGQKGKVSLQKDDSAVDNSCAPPYAAQRDMPQLVDPLAVSPLWRCLYSLLPPLRASRRFPLRVGAVS